jgi:3D (Asp-Asp-Asp) domain-containing protein
MYEEDQSIWRTFAIAWMVAIGVAVLAAFVFAKVARGATFKISEYQATKKQCGNTKGITASGHKVRPGFVAADRRHYPLGTVIQLHTGEHLIVADTGRAVRGSRHLDRWRPLGFRCRTIMSRGCVVRRGSGNPYRSVATAIEYCRKVQKRYTK